MPDLDTSTDKLQGRYFPHHGYANLVLWPKSNFNRRKNSYSVCSMSLSESFHILDLTSNSGSKSLLTKPYDMKDTFKNVFYPCLPLTQVEWSNALHTIAPCLSPLIAYVLTVNLHLQINHKSIQWAVPLKKPYSFSIIYVRPPPIADPRYVRLYILIQCFEIDIDSLARVLCGRHARKHYISECAYGVNKTFNFKL